MTVKGNLADTETTGRTVFFQEEGRVMPVDHLTDTRQSPETVEKAYINKDPYIRTPKVTYLLFGRCRHMAGLEGLIRCFIPPKSPMESTCGVRSGVRV